MVPQSELERLRIGCEIAAGLSKVGVRTGPPIPTLDGQLVVAVPPLALLDFVPGRELEGRTGLDQEWMADMLARVHRPGGSDHERTTSAGFFPWLRADAPGARNHAWLPAAVDRIRAEVDPLMLTHGLTHTDPASEAFRRDEMLG